MKPTTSQAIAAIEQAMPPTADDHRVVLLNERLAQARAQVDDILAKRAAQARLDASAQASAAFIAGGAFPTLIDTTREADDAELEALHRVIAEIQTRLPAARGEASRDLRAEFKLPELAETLRGALMDRAASLWTAIQQARQFCNLLEERAVSMGTSASAGYDAVIEEQVAQFMRRLADSGTPIPAAIRGEAELVAGYRSAAVPISDASVRARVLELALQD